MLSKTISLKIFQISSTYLPLLGHVLNLPSRKFLDLGLLFYSTQELIFPLDSTAINSPFYFQ